MTIGLPHVSRHVLLDQLRNVRDLGGHQGRAGQLVRWNRVYRADNLARASRADLAVLADLGVRTVIDLRTERELVLEPPPTFPGAPVEHHHLPVLRATWDEVGHEPGPEVDPVDFLEARYLEMLVEGAPAIADALRIIAVPAAHPIVFHCALGKDRTGVLAAVLLSLLGVHDETIAADYALSALAVTSFDEWLRIHDPAGRDAMWRQPDAYLTAPADAMLQLLAQVRSGGRSMIGFVRGIGVSFEVIEALHTQLLV